METEGERYRLYSRRALILSGGAALLTATLFGRLYYLGVQQGGQYKVLAEENRVNMRLLSPGRGEILDRFGKKIATNRKDFRAFLIPEQAKDIEKTLLALSNIIYLSEGEFRRIRREIKRQKRFLPVTIAENLSWEDFSKINVESPQLPGIQSDDGETRLYPYGDKAGQLVGYVGPVSERDMTDDPVLQLPGFKIGKEGLEKRFENNLRGAAGHSRVEVNAYGRVIRELNRQEGEAGDSLVLTLDMDLQKYTMERLAEESASVVVMDIHNGDLLVNASTPSYNSNDFNLGISTENWDALLKDPRKPLINKTISGQYPPGSTFKMAVVLAALEAGLVSVDETVRCTGKHKFGDRTYHCWKKEGHGAVDLLLSLAQSCDVYYYKLAEKVGIEKIAEMARLLGLGEPHDIGLVGQASGLVPTPEWKRKAQGGRWQVGETLNVGIGQGAILTTPLQLAVMTSRLANGGKAVKPRLVHSVGGVVEPQAFAKDIPVNRRNLAIVLEGMKRVMEQGGVAFGARLRGEGLSMAGKTGTAQVVKITQEQREDGLEKLRDRPWRERDHALFVGYGPVESPKYAVSVLVEHGGGGSRVAAPIARDVLRETLIKDPSNQVSAYFKAEQNSTIPGKD